MALVHAALRHLTVACRRERRALPILAAVTLKRRIVEFHLAAPLGAPPTGLDGGDCRWWLDPTRHGRPEEVFDAYPAVVPLGRADGAEVLVDLAAAPGPIEIDGTPRRVHGLLSDVQEGLGRAPWSRGVRVHVVDQAGGTDRVDGLADLIGDPGVPRWGGVSGRWGSPPRGDHDVILCTSPLGDDEMHLLRAAARRRDCPTVLAPGAGRGVWQWRLTDGGLSW